MERGCSFFQVHLWGVGVIPWLTAWWYGSKLTGSWGELVLNPPFKFSTSCCDRLKLLVHKYFRRWVAGHFVKFITVKCLLFSVRYGRFDPREERWAWISFHSADEICCSERYRWIDCLGRNGGNPTYKWQERKFSGLIVKPSSVCSWNSPSLVFLHKIENKNSYDWWSIQCISNCNSDWRGDF